MRARFLAMIADAPAAVALASWPELAPTLRDHVAQCRTRWPTLELAPDTILRALADRVPATGNAQTWLTSIHAADVALAAACAAGDRRALAIFEATLMPEVAAYIARTSSNRAVADEVRQVVRERLLVGSSPRIATYSGRGPLGAWLRMTAVRTAINLHRTEARHAGRAAPPERSASAPDPELDYIKARYRPVFREALEASLVELSAEHRNTLRLYFIDGLTLAEIGRMFKLHESTIARQLAKIRQHVLATTRGLLVGRHHLRPTEVDSMIGLASSQLDLSLSRILKS
jgi:RNA polymerase sigma-70 factor, ECF subfamily